MKAIEDLFGRKVDVLTYNSLHPLIKENILKEQEIRAGRKKLDRDISDKAALK